MVRRSAVRSCQTIARLWFWLVLAPLGASACGPFFPNMMLLQADAHMSAAPQASFHQELERMKLVPPHHVSRPSHSYPDHTLAAELSDLRAALDKMGVPAAERDTIVARHLEERKKIAGYTNPTRETDPDASILFWSPWELRLNPTNQSRIAGPAPQITPGLPDEFADYLRGATAWHQDRIGDARTQWLKLLRRPPTERHFKSVWAAYMLGRSWEDTDRFQANLWFQRTRQYATEGFADSLGLASASLGYEARLRWRAGRYDEAVELYLDQATGGDPRAEISLRLVSEMALGLGDSALRVLAKNPRAQRVITAYVIAGGWGEPEVDADGAVKEHLIKLLETASSKASFLPKPTPAWHKMQRPVILWLNAVEKAKVNDVESAERLALAAYQAGEFSISQRWLARAGTTPLADWLRAKFAMRAGDLHTAGTLLTNLARRFPLTESDLPSAPASAANTNTLVAAAKRSVVEELHFPGFSSPGHLASGHLLGELGVIRLTRREYTDALDALLRGGFWFDAAYVAERVMTLEELKNYVDRQWPKSGADDPSHTAPDDELAAGRQRPAYQIIPRSQIQYLLARRLARAQRYNEARPFYPAEWIEKFDALHQALQTATNLALPKEERARAYFTAAKLTRYYGLELIGTEVEPDWRVHDGQYTEGPSIETRSAASNTNVIHFAATEDELKRAAAHSPQNENRWHYRWIAAALAWEAAQLLPNNSDETAQVLCTGGIWLKSIDLPAADVFYKSLVRRCRKTAVGAEADHLRWFPRIDQDGKLILPEPPKQESGEPSPPGPNGERLP